MNNEKKIMDDNQLMLELAILQLLHPDPMRRLEAVDLLGHSEIYFKKPVPLEALEYLVPLLKDEDEEIREAVVMTLAEMGAQSTLISFRNSKIETSPVVNKLLDRVTEPFRF